MEQQLVGGFTQKSLLYLKIQQLASDFSRIATVEAFSPLLQSEEIHDLGVTRSLCLSYYETVSLVLLLQF